MADVGSPEDFPPPSAEPSEPPPASSSDRVASSRDARDGRDGNARDGSKDAKESRRSRLESVIPEILKRAVEIGVEKARESPENLKHFVHELKMPKELTHVIFQQIDDTKNGLFRVVAKEIRDFLEHTNFGGELQKILTTVQFEVNTTIRFTPNDTRERKPGEAANASETDPSDEPPGSEEDETEGETGPPSRSGIPRPEVKTAVRVRRDERDASARDARDRRRRASRSDA